MKKVIYNKKYLNVLAVVSNSEEIDMEALAQANGDDVDDYESLETDLDNFKLVRDIEGDVMAVEREVIPTNNELIEARQEIASLRQAVQELTDRLDAILNGAE